MIINYSDLEKIIPKFKDKTKVLVGGCFDLLHYGHFLFLKKSKKLGDVLIVALEPDEFIILKKKRKPVHTLDQRAEILNAMKFVNLVIKLPLMKGYKDYFELVKKVSPQYIAITKGDPQKKNKQKQAKKIGAELKEVVKRIKPFSTSYILKNAALYWNRSS